ncbi:uncharacterized protein LOC141504934 [Macrotis lagotis]|uniref:uncharacterized protein LOC141504934 n=1 Tax=Macrotis lagotis TaxID=92651 RepID=UPI003D699A22
MSYSGSYFGSLGYGYGSGYGCGCGCFHGLGYGFSGYGYGGLVYDSYGYSFCHPSCCESTVGPEQTCSSVQETALKAPGSLRAPGSVAEGVVSRPLDSGITGDNLNGTVRELCCTRVSKEDQPQSRPAVKNCSGNQQSYPELPECAAHRCVNPDTMSYYGSYYGGLGYGYGSGYGCGCGGFCGLGCGYGYGGLGYGSYGGYGYGCCRPSCCGRYYYSSGFY